MANDSQIMNKLDIGGQIKHVSQTDLENNIDAFAEKYANEKVWVTNSEGSVGSIPISQLKQALGSGYSLYDDTQAYLSREDVKQSMQEQNKPAEQLPQAEAEAEKPLKNVEYNDGWKGSIPQIGHSLLSDKTRQAVETSMQAVAKTPMIPGQSPLEYGEKVAAVADEIKKREDEKREEYLRKMALPETVKELDLKIADIDKQLKEYEQPEITINVKGERDFNWQTLFNPNRKKFTSEQWSKKTELEQQKQALTMQRKFLDRIKEYEQYDTDVTAVADENKKREEYLHQMAELDSKIADLDKQLRDYEQPQITMNIKGEMVPNLQNLFNPNRKTFTSEQWSKKTELEQQKHALTMRRKFLDRIKEYDTEKDLSKLDQFFRAIDINGDLQTFAAFGLNEIKQNLEFQKILDKAERITQLREQKRAQGDLSPVDLKLTFDEKKALILYNNMLDIASKDRGVWFAAGAGMPKTFEFIRDVALAGLGGGFPALGKIGLKTALKQAGKSLTKRVVDIAWKTPLLPGFYSTLSENKIGNYNVKNYGTNENPQWYVGQKDSTGRLIYKSWAQQATEYFTESLGSGLESIGLLTRIAKGASKAKNIIGTAARQYDKIHKTMLRHSVGKYVVGGLDKLGINSFPMEFIEEIANVPLQSLALQENQMSQLADPRFYQEIAISTAAIGGVGSAVNIATGGATAAIERRRTNKAIKDCTDYINKMMSQTEDQNAKDAFQTLIDDLSSRNFYNEDGDFDGGKIVDDITAILPYVRNNKDLFEKVDQLVKESVYREGQTEALKDIVESELGEIEYGTSGDVLFGADINGNRVFILGETDDAYLVNYVDTKEKKLIPKSDILATTSIPLDTAVTNHFVSKTYKTAGLESIEDIYQAQQEVQQQVEKNEQPLKRGDKAMYDNQAVVIEDIYTDANGQTIAIVMDNNDNPHNVPLADLTKPDIITDQDRYMLPDGRRATVFAYDGQGNVIMNILDDNNTVVAQQSYPMDEMATFEKLSAQQANQVEQTLTGQQPVVENTQQSSYVKDETEQAEQAEQQDVESQRTDPQIPIDQNGNIDFDTLLETSPELFAQEYSKIVGPEETLTQLSEVASELDKQIAQKTKAAKKQTSFNKKAQIFNEISVLQNRREALVSQIMKMTQLQEQIQNTVEGQTDTKGENVISKKWQDSQKVEGNTDVRTLPDGSQLKGRWVLAEADAATPSHNPHTLQPSEGFPTTAQGKNINDNDYTKKSAEVRIMAANYDGRAIDNPIFVKDGIVVSGNNRTMSGILAAENGTDSKYLQSLQQRAQALGFTQQQIELFNHPRVFFEVEDDIPMTTEMFAKFNQRETKSKTPTERAIVASKRDNSRLVSLILSEIDKYEKLSDVYQNQNATAAIVRYMVETGLINNNEVAELYENGFFTANGKDFLESLLIGTVIGEDQIKILNTEGMKPFRGKIVKNIIPLIENTKLRQENQITGDLNQAILYLYQAKASSLSLDEYVRQNDMFEHRLFDEDAVFVAIKLQQNEREFRSFVEQVNARLSVETPNMFTGQLENKQDIYGEFEQQFTESERAALNSARGTNAQTKALSSDGTGAITTRKEPNGVSEEAKLNDAERLNSFNEFKQRVADWASKGFKITILESKDQVTNAVALAQIEAADAKRAKGIKESVSGWFDPDTNTTYVYMPHVESVKDIDLTIIHEVVAHKGLRALLGEERYETFCLSVWNSMSKEAQDYYIQYPGVNGNKAKAADEYIAYLAEKVDLTPEEQTIWDRIIERFRQFMQQVLDTIVDKNFITDEDIATLIRMSYANIKHNVIQQQPINDSKPTADVIFRRYDTVFNSELEDYKVNKHKGLLHLGHPGPVLKASGINANQLTLSPKVLNNHLNKHSLTIDDLKGLAGAIQYPILVYKHGKNHPNIVVVTDKTIDDKKLSISVELEPNGNVVEVNNISSVHKKDAIAELERLAKMGDNLSDNLRWVEKEKVLDWFNTADLISPIRIDNLKLDSITKLINDFENPTITEQENSDEVSFRFIGAKGAAALDNADGGRRMKDLAKAKRLAKAGYDSEDIKIETGWERGVDGKWRFEDYDDDITRMLIVLYDKTIGKGNIDNYLYYEYKIKDLIKTSSLLKAYPQLGDYKVVLIPDMEKYISEFDEYIEDGVKGWYDTFSTIYIALDRVLLPGFKNYKYPKVSFIRHLLGTFVHELQHAIQKIEGFTYGAGNIYEYNKYFRNAGEVEARNVSRRLTYGPIDRITRTAESSEDVDRGDQLLFRINAKFNEDLQKQIDGILPKGYVYQLGMPGNILLSTGIANLPIQLNSTRLQDKSVNYGHNFSLNEIKDLVFMLNEPLAVFAYGDQNKSQNIVVELQKDDKHFIVGLFIKPTVNGKVLEINSIRNIFPKDNAEWLNWIAQGKALYLDKSKIQTLIDQQRTNLADVEYLDLDSITKLINDFENPIIVEDESLNEVNFRTTTGKEVSFRQVDITGQKLRKLKDGEFCHVERIFTESKYFDFTAGETIESANDVAYIFSQLEDESVENSFAVLVKDGKPYVIHVGMGNFDSTVFNLGAVIAADKLINADQVYMVHNHPSGQLKASRADVMMWNNFKKAFGERTQDGIIINLTTGKFGSFNDQTASVEVKNTPESQIPVKVYSFNKQVFDYDYDPQNLKQITGSLDVASFVSGHRLGDRAKLNTLILSRDNRVIGNIFMPYSSTSITAKKVDALAGSVVDYVLKMGGTSAIMYGSGIDTQNSKSLKNISDAVKSLSGDTIQVLDFIQIDGNAQKYESAMDEGVMFRRAIINELGVNNSLIGLHNISQDKLRKAIKQGGLANPSAAVIDLNKQIHDNYGEISLIMPKSLVDKKTGKNAGTFIADAWTPTYPVVKKEMSSKGAKVYYDTLNKLDTPLKNRIALYFKNYLSDNIIYDALYYWYALDNGLNPQLAINGTGEFTQQEIDDVLSITKGETSFWKLSKEQQHQIIDLYKAKKGGKEIYDARIKDIIEKLQSNINSLPDNRQEMVKAKIEMYQEYGVDINAVYKYLSSIDYVVKKLGEVSDYQTFQNAFRLVNEKGLRDDFVNRWLPEIEQKFDVKEFLYAGTDNQGIQKWIPNTLANASRLMNKMGLAGGTGTASFNHFVAIVAPKVTSLKQIQARKHNLSSEEEYEKFRKKWSDVYMNLALQLQPGAPVWEDYGEWRMEELANVSNPKAFAKKEYNIELSDEFIESFNDLISTIKNDFPARYFETKFARPVMLDEFVAAVVPDNINVDIQEALVDAGLNVKTYKADDMLDRVDAIKQLSDSSVLFRYTPEMDKIKTAAEKDGTFMKAPNGLPTKLNEKQWLQVRTAPFKKWFGDWEKVFIQNFLKGAPIVSLTGEEIPQSKDVKFSQQVEWYFGNNANEANSPFFGKIALDAKAASRSIVKGMVKAKAKAFASVKDVIEKGVIIDRQENYSGSGYERVLVAAPITIGNEDVICVVSLTGKDGNYRFDSHEAINKKWLLNESSGAALRQPLRPKAVAKILKNLLSPRVNASKIVDPETGEPMVVYHGTKSNFPEFDKTYNDPGSEGFFFTDASEMAESYGDIIMPVFLNIRDAYTVEGKGRNWNHLNTDIFYIIPEIEDQIRVHQIAMKRLLANGKITQKNYDYWYDKYYKKVEFIKDKSKNSVLDIIKKYLYRWQIGNFKSSMLVDRTRDFEKILQQLDEEVNIVFNDITDYGPNMSDFTGAHNVYVTTKPNNIKSAYYNNGDYSTKDDNIYFRVVTPSDVAAKGLVGTLGQEKFDNMIRDIFEDLPLLDKAAYIKRGQTPSQVVAKLADDIINSDKVDQVQIQQVLMAIKDALIENGPVVLPDNADMLFHLWKDTHPTSAVTIKEKLERRAQENDIRFRASQKSPASTNEVKLSRRQVWQERLVDRMISLKEFYTQLERLGIKISDDLDPYVTENLAMSRSQTEDARFKDEIYEPLIAKVVEIEKMFVQLGLAKDLKDAYKKVSDFLYARHAPERNKQICIEEIVDKMLRKISKEEMALFKDENVRKALMAFASRLYNEKYNPSKPQTSSTFAKNLLKTKGEDKAQQLLLKSFVIKFGGIIDEAVEDMNEIFKSKKGTNRSGMSDAEAKEIMNNLYTPQTKAMLDKLSELVRQATHFTIDTWYKYSLINEKTKNDLKAMYIYYIPLRSWEEKEDIDYSQLTAPAFNKVSEVLVQNRKAKGRGSRADDPLAYIASLAQSAIVVGNKNMIRLNLFRLIKNNQGVEGLDQFATLPKVYYVDLPDSKETIAYTERPAQELFDKGLVETKTNKAYRWHKSHAEYDAHIVPVIINGTRQMIELRGELGIKVASAVNNTNVLHWQIPEFLRTLTNWLSAVRTSYNPEFVLTNFVRDFMFANLVYPVEGGSDKKLIINLGHAFKAIHRLSSGKSVNSEWDAYYNEFLEEGGQTGFFTMRNIDQMKKDIKVMHKRMYGGKMNRHNIAKNAKKLADYTNNLSESAMRLAVYITERQNGVSPKQAAYKAHEISVNFNRKGTWSSNFGAFYSFFNASVQGTARLFSWANKYKKGAAAALTAIALTKLATNIIAAAVGGDDYDELSDYVKFSNIVIPVGVDDEGKTIFFCIPMAQGIRAVTNISDNIVDVLTGNKTVGQAMHTQLLNMMGEFLPLSFDAIDLTGRNTSYSFAVPFMPTAAQGLMDIWTNTDFKGDPIYKEPFLKSQEGFLPEFNNVYKGTSRVLVGASKYLNRAAGGSDFRSSAVGVDKEGNVYERPYGYIFDINPARAEHLLNAYLGVFVTLPSNLVDVTVSIFDPDEDIQARDLPVVNRFFKKSYKKDGYEIYYETKEFVDMTNNSIRAARKSGDLKGAATIQGRNADLIETFKAYDERVKQLNELLKKAEISTQQSERLEAKRDEIINKAAEEFQKIIKDEKDSRD